MAFLDENRPGSWDKATEVYRALSTRHSAMKLCLQALYGSRGQLKAVDRDFVTERSARGWSVQRPDASPTGAIIRNRPGSPNFLSGLVCVNQTALGVHGSLRGLVRVVAASRSTKNLRDETENPMHPRFSNFRQLVFFLRDAISVA